MTMRYCRPRLLAAVTLLFVSCTAAAAVPATRYLVRFAEPALVAYAQTSGVAAPVPLKRSGNGRTRPDLHSAPARDYVDYLRTRQQQHLADIAAATGRAPATPYTMQSALNAAIVALSPDEAARIARLPGVESVDAEQTLHTASDIGPGFTGAASVWWGSRAGQDSIFAQAFDRRAGYQGDGVVVGVIDTGYNSLSPSFQAVDASGYRIANPLGHGVFLGQCGVAGISLGGCNDKVIGVYDEYGLTSGGAGWSYSVEDELGHGSHTASTAVGDERTASLSGYAPAISGLAPHANLVVFRVCIPNTSCSSLAIAASIDQAVADGVVDVLNFSITDTTGPWLDPVAKAFLSAADAGIFVSAAAGNAIGSQLQVPGSVMNSAPWIATVGAGTHPGGAIVQGAREPMQADELAAFSLLGPTRYGYQYLKPDLQAPGVHILAATRNDGSADGAGHVAMMEGTSMATAHTSGSGALLLGLHPDWTALEAKSALMMTARESGLTKADGVTPSDFFDRGSGRVDEFLASRAGLVMDETGARLAAANPDAGGDPTTLNLPSMQNGLCSAACTFNRVFRSTQNHAVTWTARVVAAPGPAFTSVTVTPVTMTVAALAASPTVAIRADTSKVAADGSFRFAKIVLSPNDAQLTPLHLTVAVAVPAP